MATSKPKKYFELKSEEFSQAAKLFSDVINKTFEEAPIIQVNYLANGVRKIKSSNISVANFSLKDTTQLNFTKQGSYIYAIYDLSYKAPRLKYVDCTTTPGKVLKAHFLKNDTINLDEKPLTPNTSKLYEVYSIVKRKNGAVGFKIIRVEDEKFTKVITDFLISSYNLKDPSVGWN